MFFKWLKIAACSIPIFLVCFCYNNSYAYVTTANMPRLAFGNFVYGCRIGNRIYYRSLNTNITRTVNGDASKIIGYRFRFDPNFYVDATCQTKGAPIQGLYPDNTTTLNNGGGGTTAIGCTISTSIDYTTTVNGFDSNYNETNPYSYLPCPLDDYIPYLILPIGIFGFIYFRRRQLTLAVIPH